MSEIESADGPGLPELRQRVSKGVEGILRRSATLGFLGGMDLNEQIDHALGFVFSAEACLGRPPISVLDLGSGGGVPGLVLLSCWPECRIVLMDANERRTEFLSVELAERSEGASIEVVRGRAEELGRDPRLRGRFELVTSRSFGPPPVTAECGASFLSVGGLLVVSEPPEADSSGRWPVEGLAQLGLEPSDRLRFDGRFGFQALIKVEALDDRYPRRVGVPAKRPLF
jgi:16S rRNA (guanine527-N7)-methyltransferase